MAKKKVHTMVTFFMMWCMWDKKVVGNIKKWVEKCVYDASEILFKIMRYPNINIDVFIQFQCDDLNI